MDLDVLRRTAITTDYGKFFADAPVCVRVLCGDTKYCLEDGSAATENILLAARAHGLDSCWVAGIRSPILLKSAAWWERHKATSWSA